MLKVKIELIYKTIIGYLVILATLFFVFWFCDKTINLFIILFSYSSTRWIFPITYHAKTDIGCISFSILCFSVACILCLPINISIISSVLIGVFISLLLYVLQYIIELKNKYNILNTQQQCTQKVKVYNKEELIALCKQHNYNELKTEIAVKFFIDKEKPKDVWLWLCEKQHSPIEWDSVNKIKYRMKKELFK